MCSMCEIYCDRSEMFIPSTCYIKNGNRAHRICEQCWWDPHTGFAVESNSHKCIGCTKRLPLITPITTQIIIDLTSDSE